MAEISGAGAEVTALAESLQAYACATRQHLGKDLMDISQVTSKTIADAECDRPLAKCIKGLGEDTLVKLFPELKERKVTLNEIIDNAKKQQLERIENKKKPLKILDNIINKITDGVQKDKIY